jgi:tetratricopeptide (TPR) repeat protein
MDLSTTVSERERYFIKASYYLVHGQPESAIPVLEALVRLYPDHYFGAQNLVAAYGRVGRVQEAWKEVALAADLRPNDYAANARAVTTLMSVDVDQASKYALRARRLAEFQPPGPSTTMDVEIMLSRVDELWSREDMPGAFEELNRQLPKARSVPASVAVRYFKLGRNADAMALLQQDARYIREPLSQGALALRLAFYSGRNDDARGILGALLRSGSRRFLSSGFDLPASQLGVPHWEESLSAARDVIPEAADLAKGTIALEEGRNNDAVSRFQAAWSAHRDYMIYGPLIAEALSTAFERSGNLPGAIQALERSSTERLALPPQWLRNEARLSGLYRRMGRNSDARKIEDGLRKLLAVADPDHPILKELNAR